MGKFWSTLILILVAVLFIVGFRSAILSDPQTADVFQSLMGTLPFAEPISKVIYNAANYTQSAPLVSSTGFIMDIFKLMVMAFVQPMLTMLCMTLFLRMPAHLTSVDQKEAYMGGVGYRIKETVIKVITAPLAAIVAYWLATWLFQWAATQFGAVGSVLVGLGSTLLAAGIAAVPMILLGATVSVALLYRLLVTMFGGMLTALVTTVCSIWLYYAFLNGIPEQVAGALVSLLVLLILIDVVIGCFQRALGAASVS